MTGMIEGNWSYVWAAYVITWLTLGGYGLSLFLRSRAGSQEDS